MKSSILIKLATISDRHDELAALLSEPEIIAEQDKFRQLSKEYAQLEPVVVCFKQYQQTLDSITASTALLDDPDQEIQELATDDLANSQTQLATLAQQLQLLLLPRDPDDECNVYLEIRAGTGGDEAALFSGNLFHMYAHYAESKGWQLEVVSSQAGDHGGFKEIISKICGQAVYSQLKFESGTHRVQRVPETESQGRVHTSACTVAVMPEVEAVAEIDINKADLRVDTFRASGAGGQHVNKTDSAIRITHLPSGIVVECQDERSQHKNRARALALLQAKLLSQAQTQQQQEQANTRRLLVGSGDRSERIRTYNFPQGRITDHRINLTLYKLSEVLSGELAHIIQPLINEDHADQLAALGE